MVERPVLRTERLLLRPFVLGDAPVVQHLAGDWEVASKMLNLPHPYPNGLAEAWIGSQQQRFEAGSDVHFSIVRREDDQLIGSIGLRLVQAHGRAELGFWLGRPYWNHDYCTEAAKAVIEYGFQVLGLDRIYASHFTHNPASGRVLEKAGMAYEGLLRHHVQHWGTYEDLKTYAIFSTDFGAG